MIFASPYYLLLLLLLVPALVWYIVKRRKRHATLQVSNTFAVKQFGHTWKQYFEHAPFALRCLVFALVVVVLARPQSVDSWQNTSTEGIDIVVALDISTSMLAEDLKPNRLEAAKSIASSFIAGRHSDNIGLVVFAGESFTQCPLTTDHAVLINLFNSIHSGLIEDGTAIGLGLANAVSRIKDSEAKSKVIILLTDGTNNRGDIDPLTAAELDTMLNNPASRVDYKINVGDDVRILSGPLENFTGVVEEIDMIREKMTVRVKMFLGREMQVELDLDQVDKASTDS